MLRKISLNQGAHMSGKVTVSPYNPVQQSGCRAPNPPNLFAVANFAPTAKDNNANVGDLWVYLNDSAFVLVGKPLGVANWEGFAGSGVSSITGTANQITTSASTGAVTLSVPSTFIAPGSIAATTTVTAATGLNLSGSASRISINAGTASTAAVGTSAVMSGSPGTVTITTSACTTSSLIQYSRKIAGGTLGEVTISTQNNGSFILTSNTDETSTFNYLIIN